jgi:predicted MFS family arabinose efflux permease
MATIIMVVGTALKYWAISTSSLDGHTLLGMKAQVVIAGLGFAIFGVGVEIAGITVSKIIVKWFKGKELALAMGLEMSTARIGTTLALATSVPIAKALGGVSMPILVCLIMLCIGMISFFLYAIMDKKLDKSIADEVGRSGIQESEESFRVSDILLILKNKGWWLIAILCLLFYSGVFPFIKFATDLMINKFHITEEFAGLIPSMLTVGAIAMTPLFGNLYDRKGSGATIMIIGAFLLIFVHAMFAIPFFSAKFIAIILIIILGVAFSLVPSAMWPSVPKIIPERQLGTAYGMIFMVQNVGLMLVPLLIGWVLNKYCISGKRMVDGVEVAAYNYTLPMIIFAVFGLLAIIVGFLLKAEDRKKGYGLELPNIKK